MSYDLIGDIHGHARELRALLERLGYAERAGVYRHDSRTAVFVGDFIDRGPDNPGVVSIVRSMVEDGSALAVMGNHELNALCFHTEDPERKGEYLRPHIEKNIRQHQATMEQFSRASFGLDDALAWFRTLPLWLDLGPLRVVHACWQTSSMNVLIEDGVVSVDGRLTEDGVIKAGQRGTRAYDAAEILLKGLEIKLPEGIAYHDKEGTERSEVRIRWWTQEASPTYRSLAIGPKHTIESLPEEVVSESIEVGYHAANKPVVVGHYWLNGQPEPLTSNVACVDYSVAMRGGKLTAYRFTEGRALSRDGFAYVSRVDES